MAQWAAGQSAWTGRWHATPTRLSCSGTRVESFAGDLRMPVHEHAGGVLLPRPDMQRIESRQAEAVRALEQMQELSHELRRADAFLVPGVSEHQEISADELQPSAWRRLVDHNLGLRRIELPVSDESQVDVVKAHR